ncbi:MAG: hypothetical protein RMM51_09350 [Verrucomicrobiae bacterium]|nr:hypothetical protein [Verrucomicrobiae bacterium]
MAGLRKLWLITACLAHAAATAAAQPEIVARVGTQMITRAALLAAVREQTALKGESFDALSPERQFNYAMTVLQRKVDDAICEQLATDEMRKRARANAERDAVRLPAAAPASFREGLYYYHLYRELAGRPPGDAEEKRIREQWRTQVPVRWRLYYSDVVHPKGRPPQPAEWLVATVVVCLVAGGGVWLLRRENAGTTAFAALVAGALVRVITWAGIPHDYLAYDVDGHLEYVRYVHQNRSLPAAEAGFQFYQPPLYYMLGATIAGPEPRNLQTVGLAFSVATLVVGLCVVPVGLGAWLLAMHPAWVLTGARINNDVAVTFWVALAWAAAWRGWTQPQPRWHLLAVVAAASALWTKATGLVAVPVVAMMLARERQWLWLVGLTVILLLLPAGLTAGNVQWLTPGIRLEPQWSNWFTFNPWRVVSEPFVNPLLPGPSRDHLWEYWIRSALFGEFSFSWLAGWASVLMALWLVVLVLAIGGIILAMWRNPNTALPVALALITVIAAQALYVWRAPFATSQDFRYLAVVLLPIAWAVNEGLRAVVQRQGRRLQPALAQSKTKPRKRTATG